MLKRSLLLLSLSFLFFNATFFATGESGWIYVLNRNYNEISVIEPGEKRLIYRIPLSGQDPTAIYPAPSGKYLFITFKDSELISVVDTEEQKEEIVEMVQVATTTSSRENAEDRKSVV